MKKIMVVIVGMLCLAAILVVAFFGTLPYTKEANIYCDYIEMNMAREKYDSDGNKVYIVKERPEESIAMKDPDWYDNDYSYRIQIHNIKYILDKDAQLNLHCKAMTNKTGKVVTDEKLNFYCVEPTNYTTYLDFNKSDNNIINFVPNKSLYPKDSMTVFTFKVQSNDAHKNFINIRLQIQGIGTQEVNL